MAKYLDMGIADVSFTADVDLTTKQYYFVAPASTPGNVATATSTSAPAPLGILQNSPSLGQEARVRVVGFSKVIANQGTCVVNWGRYGYCASDGRFEALLTAGSVANARWLGSASSTAGSLYGQVYLFGAGVSVCPAAAS